jgi:hypothetical protein
MNNNTHRWISYAVLNARGSCISTAFPKDPLKFLKSDWELRQKGVVVDSEQVNFRNTVQWAAPSVIKSLRADGYVRQPLEAGFVANSFVGKNPQKTKSKEWQIFLYAESIAEVWARDTAREMADKCVNFCCDDHGFTTDLISRSVREKGKLIKEALNTFRQASILLVQGDINTQRIIAIKDNDPVRIVNEISGEHIYKMKCLGGSGLRP